jgi:hypothetical protein
MVAHPRKRKVKSEAKRGDKSPCIKVK